MATPKAVVPLHEPSYEVQTFDNDNVMCDESHDFSPSLLEDNETGDYANDHDPPLGDHPSWDDVDFDELFGDGVEEEPSTSNRDETNGQGGQHFNGNPIPLAVWPPVPPQPYACTCCQVLREIIHTNGVDTAKLEIHGRLGMICHGILEKGGVDRNDQKKEYQMFDFCKESVSNVKQFLVQYCEEHKQAGYTMVQDPLSIFYEALCVGLHWDFNFDVDDLFQGSPIDLNPQAQNNAVKAKKRPLAEQRQRTKQLTFRDLVGYFHMSEETAAVELQLCASALKNICRREGIRRWPHRRIISYEKKIEAQKRIVNATVDAEERARALAEIERLNQMIRNIYQLRNQ